jgi:hypothetical protein
VVGHWPVHPVTDRAPKATGLYPESHTVSGKATALRSLGLAQKEVRSGREKSEA